MILHETIIRILEKNKKIPCQAMKERKWERERWCSIRNYLSSIGQKRQQQQQNPKSTETEKETEKGRERWYATQNYRSNTGQQQQDPKSKETEKAAEKEREMTMYMKLSLTLETNDI